MLSTGEFWKPGRLVNLWDIMKKFDGKAFGAWQLIASTHTKWSAESIQGGAVVRNQLYQPETLALLTRQAQTLASVFSEVGLETFANAANELLAEIDKATTLPNGDSCFSGQNLGSALWQMRILAEHFPVQMENRILLMMQEGGARLYQPTEPLFGQEVNDRFPSKARSQIEEAAKCLALGLSTACVFHLMRTMELALEGIRLCLQVQILKPQDKTWGGILGLYRKEIAARDNPQHSRQWQSENDKKFFASLHDTLVAVKDSIRDKTMHTEFSYNQEQAELVFGNVREFMRKVASRMDEDGLPLA
jgi:hypothetical protein